LLVSGKPKERAAWRTALSDSRYVISEVENGVAALKAIILEEADIIIAGVTMARLDALELLRAAHDLEQSPPIVGVASGNSEINQVYWRTANLLGAAATYMHPFDAAEFTNGINAVLSARKSRKSRS